MKSQIEDKDYFDKTPMKSEISGVTYVSDQFIFCFRSVTPQPREEYVNLIHSYRVIILRPYEVKNFMENMKESIKEYEKEYGKIKIPKNVLKERTRINKQSRLSAEHHSTDNSYVG